MREKERDRQTDHSHATVCYHIPIWRRSPLHCMCLHPSRPSTSSMDPNVVRIPWGYWCYFEQRSGRCSPANEFQLYRQISLLERRPAARGFSCSLRWKSSLSFVKRSICFLSFGTMLSYSFKKMPHRLESGTGRRPAQGLL